VQGHDVSVSRRVPRRGRRVLERAEAGRLKSGRCAEVDETGREFHFEVSAITVEGRQFLLFERASEAEEVRDVLQKARELALERESLGRALDELRAAVTVLGPAGREVQSSTRAILDVVDRLADTEPSPVQQSLLQELRGASAYLQASVDAMVRTSRVFAQRSTPDDHQP
jgi:hypothetical protein